MRYKITYRDTFWRTIMFASFAYALIVETAIRGLDSLSSIPLFLLIPGIGVFHLIATRRSYASLDASGIVISERGQKLIISYTAIVAVRVDGSRVEVRYTGYTLSTLWRKLFRREPKECSRSVALQEADEFAAALRPRLLSQSMLEVSQPEETAPHDSVRGVPTQPGGLRRRALAHLVDGLIVGFIWFNTICAISLYGVTNDKQDDETVNLVGNMVGGFGLQAIWFLYHWIFTSAGATPGKRLLSLSIGVGPELDSPGILRGLVRTVAQIISLIPLGLGFWWAARNPDRLTWHDRFAGTRVIRRSRRPASWRSPSPAPSGP